VRVLNSKFFKAIHICGWLFCFLLFSCTKTPEPIIENSLPSIGVIPDFLVTNQRGEDFGKRNLKGRAAIVNFIFSRCPSVCPEMLKQTSELHLELKNYGLSLMFVTFTVDPDHDTPIVLRKLAESYSADQERWAFLTSPNKEMLMKLFKEGFKVGVSEPMIAKDLFDIAHSEKMVLVDKKGHIRGYYSYEAESLKTLKADLAQVMQEVIK
jgi:protein SCO1